MQANDPEIVDLLEQAMVARIATVSRSGRPHVNPLYFVIEDGHIKLGTATYTLAARNIEATPEVQILLEVERNRADRRILRMTGTAEVRTDPPQMRRYRRAVARKYVVTPGGLWNMLTHPRRWIPMRRHMQGAGGCVIDVSPTAVELLVTAPTDSGA